MMWKQNESDERVTQESHAVMTKNFRTAVLLLTPGMMWLMGTLRGQNFSLWVYAAPEVILLGGLLAQEMTRRSGCNADARLQEAEESDEE